MPNWARDHSISLHPRHSRASSIVSTRTKTSINTIQEDTRSIDIVLGAQSFHINRDGSKISVSNKEELPPYSSPAPSNPGSNSEVLSSGRLQDPVSSPGTPRESGMADQHDDSHISHEPGEPSTPPTHSWEFSNEQYTSIASTPTNADDLVPHNALGHVSVQQFHTESETAPVKPEEPRTWQSLPVKPGLRGNLLGRVRHSASHGSLREAAQLMDGTKDTIPWLRRRYSVRLPKILANESGGKLRKSPGVSGDPEQGSGSLGSPVTRPSFGRSNHRRSKSSTLVEQDSGNKITTLPNPRSSAVTVPKLSLSSSGPSGPHLAVPESPVHVEEGHAESDAPPPMESDNDISIHYTRLIRSIDRDHRRALHLRDKELAAQRERLNEVDQVYRKELKSRDFTIDDLRSRLQALEDNMQSRIETAQNEVEDLWEMRWKDRDRHLMERMRRIELDSQKCVERAVAERDEEWGAEWARKNEQLLARLKVAEEAVR